MRNPVTYQQEHSQGASERTPTALAVPTLRECEVLQWDSAIAKSRGVYGFDSLDPRSRSFNMIRAKIHELRTQRGWRLFGVLSATPKVGKSFITFNVAAALSRDPRFNTTAVDLDLRRASLTEVLGVDPPVSIRAFLEERPGASMPTAYALDGERLVILPTTAGPIRSAELLAGPRAQALLRSFRATSENSLFMVDLPPVFANDDAVTTMAQLDGYIVVAEEGRTTTREVKDVIGLLGAQRLAGVILNKYQGGIVSEGYGFDSYYGAGYYFEPPAVDS
ncbi:CpsD/CapB family tyrosine-protein kinase [Sphingomonas limnosediminicola]|uniref:CpsD/CapB family tyrosine-protein kinase n=2 Tax=Sphingomonas limnosediminicola TaxID=940133 RepID=A0ABP7L549_9SPHN